MSLLKWFKNSKNGKEQEEKKDSKNNVESNSTSSNKKDKRNIDELKEQKKQYKEEKAKKREENLKRRQEEEQLRIQKQKQEEEQRKEEFKRQQEEKQKEFLKRKEEQEIQKQKQEYQKKKTYEQEEEKFDFFGYEVKDLKQGMSIKTRVLSFDGDMYILDAVDNYSEVYMPKNETFSQLNVGDEVDTVIYRNTNGEFHVSQKRLKNKEMIDEVKKMAKEQEIVKGKIVNFENKNYIVKLENDLEGFVYYNNIDLYFVDEPEKLIGEEYEFLVKEVFPNNKIKVELTRIPLLKKQLKENLNKVEVGQIITVQDFVKNKAGIEFKYEGFKVFIPYKLLSHAYVESDGDLSYLIGKEAKVTECEETKFGYNIVASIRELEGDPFDEVANNLQEDDEVQGKISKIEHYGMFIQIAPAVRALLHKNDYSLDFLKDLDSYKVGDEVKVKIKSINLDKKQIDVKCD